MPFRALRTSMCHAPRGVSTPAISSATTHIKHCTPRPSNFFSVFLLVAPSFHHAAPADVRRTTLHTTPTISMARRPPDLEGTHSLLVLNISFRTTPEDLRNEFKRFGTLAYVYKPIFHHFFLSAPDLFVTRFRLRYDTRSDVYIPRSHGNSRGYAFVRYYNKEEADNARREMDKKTLDNREVS